ncbi:MAG: hypothetical protein RL065_293, partial [Bacteroidota bacterium]
MDIQALRETISKLENQHYRAILQNLEVTLLLNSHLEPIKFKGLVSIAEFIKTEENAWANIIDKNPKTDLVIII